MKESIILAFDVGGTQIKAAAFVGGKMMRSSVSHYESYADRSAEEIVAHLIGIAEDLVAKANRGDLPIDGIGMAFPGPFEYENGISRIQGLGKFESLYGLPVRELLERALRMNDSLRSRLTPTFGFRFENDVALFGLGEAGYGQAYGAEKAVCLTLGTGLGSCYLEGGRIMKQGTGIPDNGWLYSIPYEDGIADDYLSRRGLLRLARERGLDCEGKDVHDFAMLAFASVTGAKELFQAFGRRMTEILAPALLAYAPDTIVFGGQISKSGSLFLPTFEEGLASMGLRTKVRVSHDTLISTFRGIYDFVVGSKKE